MSGRDDRFLDRWSRRKRAAGAGDREEDPSTEDTGAKPSSFAADEPAPADITEEDAGLGDAKLCEKLGLPEPGSMAKGDDFKAFFAAGVPARLRNLALRRLWRVNPALGRLDDLIDYADDYSDAATALGTAQTTYQVGQGLRAHVEKLRAAAEDKAASDEPIADGVPPNGHELEEAATESSQPDENPQPGAPAEAAEAVASPAPGEHADEPAEQARHHPTATPVDRDPAAASKARERASARPRHMVFRSVKLPNS